MKFIKIILIGLLLSYGATFLQAQDMPAPPPPPEIDNISIHFESDSTSSWSYSISTDDDEDAVNNLSISISNSDDRYKLKAKFDSGKNEEIAEILKKEMSSKNFTKKNKNYTWKSETKNDEVYKVVLQDGKLKMELDKRIASTGLIKKFESLGQTIRQALNSGNEQSQKYEAQRLQREADRLQREADRMQREAERMRREAKQVEKKIADQYSHEANLISTEAAKLSTIASTYDLEASHKGAISSNLQELLEKRMTYYDETTENGFNWTWPTTQNALLDHLESTLFIPNKDDVSFIKDKSGIYVNGQKLSKSETKKVLTILDKMAIKQSKYYSFYKQFDHILLINDDIVIEKFFDDLRKNNLISKRDSEGIFQLNGTSAYKNGKQLDSDQLALINKLAIRNNIIPAPGKIASWETTRIYRVGYMVDKKTMVGTWMSNN